jgi:hypothetical protein
VFADVADGSLSTFAVQYAAEVAGNFSAAGVPNECRGVLQGTSALLSEVSLRSPCSYPGPVSEELHTIFFSIRDHLSSFRELWDGSRVQEQYIPAKGCIENSSDRRPCIRGMLKVDRRRAFRSMALTSDYRSLAYGGFALQTIQKLVGLFRRARLESALRRLDRLRGDPVRAHESRFQRVYAHTLAKPSNRVVTLGELLERFLSSRGQRSAVRLAGVDRSDGADD